MGVLAIMLSTLLITITTALPQTSGPSVIPEYNPAPPGLTFLYRSFVNITNPINVGVGPKGARIVIPIVGGDFTGTKLTGKYPYKLQGLLLS